MEAFDAALERGVQLLDTAEIYGSGHSEALIGEAIRGRRDQVFIASKVLPLRFTTGGIEKAARASIRRLQVDAIDLYQLHFPGIVVPIGHHLRAMERLVRKGLVRYLGVSNVGARSIQRAREALRSEDIVSDQVEYSLLFRKPEKSLLPYVQKERVTLIAYSPLGQGALTGKYGPRQVPRDMARSLNPYFSPGNMRRAGRGLDALRRIASKRGKSPAQVALNWLMRKRAVLPIPGVKTASQARDATEATQWRLTKTERREVEEAFGSVRVSTLRAIPWMIGRPLLIPFLRPRRSA